MLSREELFMTRQRFRKSLVGIAVILAASTGLMPYGRFGQTAAPRRR